MIILLSCFAVISADLTDGSPSSLMIGPPPMIMDDIDHNCWNFTYGNWRVQEFYTPNYPGEYLNNTDCVLYLEAPSGFKINLDFRDKFILEKSDGCKYDFLEVRDGPFAYSPVISRFCGAEFPPIITSSGRYLWLRFKTDDLLQYGGFRAVYSYHKDHVMNKGDGSHQDARACRIPIKLSNGEADGMVSTDELTVQDFSNTAVTKGQIVDCTWEIYTDKSHRIHLRSSELEIKQRKRCDLNNVTIYERSTLESSVKEEFCRSQNEIIDVMSTSNRLFVRVFGSSISNMPNVKLTYTLIRNGDCNEMEFPCDVICIPAGLVCNGVDNCRDGSDERDCSRIRASKGRGHVGGSRGRHGGDVGGSGGSGSNVDGKESSSDSSSTVPIYVIILGAVGGAIVTLVSICICVMCRLKGKDRGRRQESTPQKAVQKNALEMAVSNSSNTTLSLSRQNNECQGLRTGPTDRQHYVTFAKVNPVPATTIIKDESHRYSLTEHGLPLTGDDIIPEIMTGSGNYKRFLAMDNHSEDMMRESLHSHIPGKYPPSPGGILGMTNPDYRTTDPYQNYHGSQWQPSLKDEVVMFPYGPSSLSSQSPFLGLSKPFSFNQPENKFESKYLKALKTKENEGVREYQGS